MSQNNKTEQQSGVSQRIVTWQEYAKHIIPQDCWVLIEGYLYDVSDYLVEHPGGDDILLKYSGIDATQPFNDQQHSEYAISLRDARRVGKIESPVYSEQYRLMLQQKKKKLKQARKAGQNKIRPFRENITLDEVKSHNSEKSCWIVIQDKVYDVTEYMPNHPGGEGLILDKAGQDATVAFNEAKHSMDAIEKKEGFLIGTVQTNAKNTSNLVLIVFSLVLAALASWFFIDPQSE